MGNYLEERTLNTIKFYNEVGRFLMEVYLDGIINKELIKVFLKREYEGEFEIKSIEKKKKYYRVVIKQL